MVTRRERMARAVDPEEKARLARLAAHKEAEVNPRSGPDTVATADEARHGKRDLDANGHPTEAQMQRDDAAFLTAEYFEARMTPEERAEYQKELDKEKPVECIVQTPNAILPVDAKRNKEKVEAGSRLQIGDTVMLKPHVIKRHQNAGVGLSLVKSEA